MLKIVCSACILSDRYAIMALCKSYYAIMGVGHVENTNLVSLAEMVLAGDTQAYETIFLETKDNIFFHAKTILLSDEAAWDAVQDSFIAAFRSLDKLQSADALELWLCAITSNLCFLRLKKQSREKADGTESKASEPSEAAIRALPDVQRIALMLRYCDNMSPKQIGSVIRSSAEKSTEYISAAEKALNAEETPATLKAAFEKMRAACQLSPALTLSIGGMIAQKCGYRSSLRVTSDLSTKAEIVSGPARAEHTAGTAMGAGNSEKSGRATRDEKSRQSSKWNKSGSNGFAVIAAAALVVLGVGVGAFAIRSLVSDKAEVVSVGASPVVSGRVDGTAALSRESAQAYIGLLTGYTGKLGVCQAASGSEGLAYVRLIDFDGDGQYELYLYYIDKNFSEESAQYAVSETGEALFCLHEELWKWNGTLTNCFTQEHFYNSAAPTELNSKGRWLINDDGNERLALWYSNIDENGYTNQYLTLYTLSDSVLETEYEVSAMFVAANAARERRDGYLLEEYYGTENSQFDDVGYFVEGAVKSGERRESFTYEDCLALSDLNTSDIVPIGDWDADSPVAILKDFYDKRTESGTQLIYNNGTALSWQLSDINSLLSELADTSVGG